MLHGIQTQRTYLFTDLRHILCSDLRWLGPDGKALALAPTGPRVEPVTDPGLLPQGVRLVAQRASKTEPIPVAEAGSAVPLPPRTRILYDGGAYRAWGLRPHPHSAGSSQPPRYDVVVSESRDGFDWREAHACTLNSPGGPHIDGFGMFIDPAAAPGERYKAVFCAEPPEAQWPALFAEYARVNRHHRIWRFSEKFVMAMYGLVSPDGLDWRPLPGHLMVQYSDTDTSVYHDAKLGKYVMYTRLMLQGRRWIGRAESDDFRTWEPIYPWIGPSLDWPSTYDVYQNGFCRYPGEESYYLMFPMVYRRWDQRSDIHLYSSDDGIAWLKVPGDTGGAHCEAASGGAAGGNGAVIEPGATGSFDSEFIFVGKDLVPWGSDRIAIPYGGTRFPHKYPRWQDVLDAPRHAWATWPRGRLAAMRADGEGRFVTFPMIAQGQALRVNARVARGGELRVGVVDMAGRSASECDPIVADGLNLPVTWKGQPTIQTQPQQEIMLDFHLRAAEVFGFEWE